MNNKSVVASESHIDSETLANCWAKIKSEKGTDVFVDSFYSTLFKQHPEIRSLFPDNLKTQKTSLLSMLNSVINGAEFINHIDKEILELGQRHKNIGITKEMYGYFIDAIITAANSSSNFSLSKEELAVWKKAFRKISDVMLSAY